jgi:eukaryotic-like serine/threonine-protein kinase
LIAGRYEIVRPLGHGAMSVVDLAHDTELDRDVAIKRLAENLSRDEELRARFLREARLAGRLHHPNVVAVSDVGEEDGRPFIAMEHVDGETLAELVERDGPLPPDDVASLGVQACRALAAAHAAGLVHRDVKPQNLLLRRDGTLKLGDFGIAFGLEGTRMTVAGTVLGTAAYLAPEQARGEEVTAAADIYGLGAVLYELSSGRPPRRPASLAELGGDGPIAPLQSVPPALAAIVMRCLDPDPAARPASAADLAHELASTLPDADTIALPAHPARRATEILAAPVVHRTRRRVPPLLTAAVALVVAGAIAAVVTTHGGGTTSPPPRTTPTVASIPREPTALAQAQAVATWLERYSARR